MVKDVVQRSVRLPSLTMLLLAIGLITSRVTLVAHEFLGHAGVAAALGSRVERYHLFLFAGGYVDVARATPYTTGEHLAIYLGGLALELCVGVVLLLVSRRMRMGSLARVAVVGFATINLVHACFYFAAGTFHGYGDGWMLHHQLGGDRVWLVSAVAVVLVPATYVLARILATSLRGWLPDTSRTAAAAIIGGALVMATAGHAGLAFGELAVSPSAVYGSTMRHESERKVRRDVAVYVRKVARSAGTAPTAAEIARATAAARRRHRTFPLQWVLAALLLIATAAGIWRAPRLADAPTPTRREAGWLAGTLVASLALVAVLKLLS